MSIRRQIRKITVKVEENRKKFTLEYCTLEKEICLEGAAHKTYGIEVLKQEYTDAGTMRIEYRKIFDIFCTEQEAIATCRLLCDNTVTPVSLKDIIEQLIGTDEIEYEEYEVMAV